MTTVFICHRQVLMAGCASQSSQDENKAQISQSGSFALIPLNQYIGVKLQV
jgi:hypothetical protein